MSIKRRTFIKNTALVGAGLAVLPKFTFGKPSRESKLRMGFIGVGLRGTWHLENTLRRDDVEVTAICDIDPHRIEICKKKMKESGQDIPLFFGKNEDDYKTCLK